MKHFFVAIRLLNLSISAGFAQNDSKSIPLFFFRNPGIANSEISFIVETPELRAGFRKDSVAFQLPNARVSVRFAGASDAEPAPGVIDAICNADVVLIAPSNPITSIGPILAVPAIHDALLRVRGKIAAVSPIVGSAPVAGPAGILMEACGLPCSIAGVAKAYSEFLDILICDSRDSRAAEALRQNGLRVQCTQTIMRSAEDKAALARETLSFMTANLFREEPATDMSFRRLDRQS